jgi:hypothetical protein
MSGVNPATIMLGPFPITLPRVLPSFILKRAKSIFSPSSGSLPFKVLHGALMFLCGRKCVEGAEVSALAGFWVFLARIETVLS